MTPEDRLELADDGEIVLHMGRWVFPPWLEQPPTPAKLPGRTPFGNPDDPHAEPTAMGFPPGDASP